jgi:hypothetical protein
MPADTADGSSALHITIQLVDEFLDGQCYDLHCRIARLISHFLISGKRRMMSAAIISQCLG